MPSAVETTTAVPASPPADETEKLLINVAAHLPAMARSHPDRPAVIFPESRDRAGRVAYTHLTFRQLDEESDRLARGLEHVGVRRGVRTVLMVTPSLDFFALTFALFKVGAVLVMVDPGMGVRNLKACLAEAEPEAFIGVPKAHVARKLLGWGRGSIRCNVTVGRRLFWGGTTLDNVRRLGDGAAGPYPMLDPERDDVAAILFTSGSTGVPKGAVYTHGNFASQVEMIRRLYAIEPGEIDLPTFPLFALFDPALGMTAVIPDMDATRPGSVDPRRIVEAIRDFGVTNMFGSPALVDRVGRHVEAGAIRLPSLRRVISAGAPVPPSVIARFGSALDESARIVTPYGATESLPVASIASDEILRETAEATNAGRGVCVGRPVPEVEVAIIRITDEPIASWSDDLVVERGAIGEIVVRGPNVTRRYWGRDEQTALAKILDPGVPEGFRHRMGDLGYLDETGRLWMCGRKSHRVGIDVDGSPRDLYTVPCEAPFNVHPKVRRTALVGVPADPSAPARRPVLCVELEADAGSVDRDALCKELLEVARAHDHTRSIETILFHPSFPVDIRHNAKIFREKLAGWAADQLR